MNVYLKYEIKKLSMIFLLCQNILNIGKEISWEPNMLKSKPTISAGSNRTAATAILLEAQVGDS